MDADESGGAMSQRRFLLAALVLLALIGLAGCSSSSDGGSTPTPGFTQYTGTFTNGSSTGILTLDIQPVPPSPAPELGVGQDLLGTLVIGGGSEAVNGTLNGALVSASSASYNFTGGLNSGDVMSGTFTGPGDPGEFVLAGTSAMEPVEIFCGGYTGDDTGTWNLIRSGNSLVGQWNSLSFNDSGTVTGSIAGGSIVSGNYTSGTGGGSILGTVMGTDIGGTWNGTAGDSGLWGGQTSLCPTED